ncbi:MAG: tetratricopeptide repeat protein [Candidatus Poribacteria bacterium]|nr:tetratricopeptide repeat protein [Candidatus Poribacteria bacterium]
MRAQPLQRITSIALCLWLIAVGWQGAVVQAQDSSEFTEAVERYRARIRQDPKNLDLHRTLIEHTQQTDRLAVPLHVYTASYEKQPTNPIVLYVLAYTYLMDGAESALMKAETLLQSAIRQQPDFADAYAALGECYMTQGKSEAGIEALQKSVQLSPDLWFVHLELANYYRDQKNYQGAIAHYTQSLAQHPEAATTHFHLGTVYRQTGNFEAAYHAFSQAIQHNERYADAYYQLGQIYALQGEPAAALEQYRAGRAFDPNNAQARYQLAHIFLDQNEERHAVLSVRSALATDAKYAEYVERLKDVSVFRATDIIAQTLKEHPDNTDLQRFAGELFLKIDSPQDPLKLLEHTQALDPNLASTHYVLGVAYDRTGDVNRAVAEFQKATEIDPSDPRPHLYLGKKYASSGQPHRAISAFAQAIEAEPDNVAALKDYAFLCLAYEEDGWKPAKRALEAGIKIRPNDPEIVMNYAHTLLLSQKKREAIAYYLLAIELRPGWILSHYNLAIAYESIGEAELALAEYQKVAQLDSGGSHGEKALERIQILTGKH